MKKFINFKEIDLSRTGISLEEACNSFLKTRQGLQYLLMKYPTLTVKQAVKEYKRAVTAAAHLT